MKTTRTSAVVQRVRLRCFPKSSFKEQILAILLKDANSVSENVSQEKEEINEGDSSQSVAEVHLYISKEQNIQTFENKKNKMIFFFIFL